MSQTFLSFDAFVAVLADYFELPQSLFDADAKLISDIGFDSVMFVEVVDMLESMSGHQLAGGAVASLESTSDIYNLYKQFASSSS